jgi:hypothetical protein
LKTVEDILRIKLGNDRYNPNKYRDMDDEDDRNMEVGFSKIQAEERRR